MKKTIKKMLGITAAAALTLSMGAMALVGCGGKGVDYTFEAETATLGGAAVAEEGKHVWTDVETMGEGAEIAGVGYLNSENDTVTWTITAAAACKVTITVHGASVIGAGDNPQMAWLVQDEEGKPYWSVKEADPSAEGAFSLYVNDTKASLSGKLPALYAPIAEDYSNMFSFFDSGFWNVGTVKAKVSLKAGDNTIVFKGPGVNLDKIVINSTAELTEKTA